MRTGFYATVFAGLALLLTGCRKELCYEHEQHALRAGAVVRPEWRCLWETDNAMNWRDNWPEEFGYAYGDLLPEPGAGIAAVVYNEDGSRDERHLPAAGGMLPMSEGPKSILFYNDDTRFIVFNGMDSHLTSSASTRTRTRATYTQLHGDERTVNAPDMLYAGWVESYLAQASREPESLAAHLEPRVYTYLVRYRFDSGLEHVALARGALAGMAESVRLKDGATGEQRATILFDCELAAFGAQALVPSFGVPSFDPATGRSDAPASYTLNLEVCLKSGQLKNFEFDISEQIASQPHGGVITVGGLTISDTEAGVEGGFDVSVDGWGQYEDIILPLV